jgi:uncharacterized protein (DUF924 family)
MLSKEDIDNILTFWFPNNVYNKFWFEKNEVVDKLIHEHFYTRLFEIYNKYKNITDFNFMVNEKEILATIILLDQFSRNMCRIDNSITSEKINEMTHIARLLTLQWLSLNTLILCPINFLVFYLMPLRHLNNISDYKMILSILEKVDNKENEIYKKFFNNTQKRFILM